MKGVHPAFIVDSDKPGKVLTLISASKLLGEILPDRATEAALVSVSDTMIMAMEKDEEAVWTYALFPSAGTLMMTKHGNIPGVGAPYVATFWSQCTFAWLDPPAPE